MNPVFIRKKYGSFQDEADLQKQIGPIYQNKKRIEAIREAIQNKANVAILDDGFQDFSINKNLSIVCFNEKQWIGNGLVIPSGPLREDLSALKRADCVIINGEKNIDIETTILNKNKEVKIFYIKYIAQNIEEFKNKKVTAFAGIGNPENFFNLLKDNNINVVKEMKFPDHYNYSKKELENLGYNIVIYPVTTQRLAMKSVEDGLRTIMNDGHQNNIIDKMQTRKRLYDLIDYEKYNTPDKKITDFKTDGHE